MINIEDMFGKIMDEMRRNNVRIEKRIETNEIQIENEKASIKNLKMHIGHIHSLLSQIQPGVLLSDTEKNPREQANTVTLRVRHDMKDRNRKREAETNKDENNDVED